MGDGSRNWVSKANLIVDMNDHGNGEFHANQLIVAYQRRNRMRRRSRHGDI